MATLIYVRFPSVPYQEAQLFGWLFYEYNFYEIIHYFYEQ